MKPRQSLPRFGPKDCGIVECEAKMKFYQRALVAICAVVLTALIVIPGYAQEPTGQLIGEVRIYAGNAYSSPPYGFLRCDGSAVSRSDYASLFGIIGTTYGSGDGSTTFNLPNTSGGFVLGSSGESAGGTSCGNQTCYLQRGATGGEYAHQLTIGEMPEHRHGTYNRNIYAGTGASGASFSVPSTPVWNLYAGNDEAHNNVPPYVSMYYIIAFTSSLTNAAPTATPEPQATYTPWPTYTPEPTYTPQPTYTPSVPTPECAFPAFPAAPLIDDFNRADEGSPPSAEWGNFPGKNGFAVVSNTIIAEDSDSYSYYLTQFQPENLEAYARISQVPPSGPYAEYIIIGNSLDDGYGVGYVGGSVTIIDKASYAYLGSTVKGTLVDSEIGLRYMSGVLSAYYRPPGGAWSEVLTATVAITQPSYVYIWGADTSGLDDLHAGNITCEPITIPTPDAYTQTLSSGHTISLPLVISSGQLYVGLFLILLCLTGVSLFLVRFR